MMKEEAFDSNEIVFELLKIVFFIVTYLLINNGNNIDYDTLITKGIDTQNSFYNTLFIFSASTWVDYLSMFSFQRKRKFYYGGYEINRIIPIICSIFGTLTVTTSMFCVCVRNKDCLIAAIIIYYASLFYVYIKSYIIIQMVISDLKK